MSAQQMMQFIYYICMYEYWQSSALSICTYTYVRYLRAIIFCLPPIPLENVWKPILIFCVNLSVFYWKRFNNYWANAIFVLYTVIFLFTSTFSVIWSFGKYLIFYIKCVSKAFVVIWNGISLFNKNKGEYTCKQSKSKVKYV